MRNAHAIALCLLSATAAFLCGAQKREVIGSPVYVTAAHLDPSALPGYTRIYADTDRDTAYYLKDNYNYYTPSVGEEVVISSIWQILSMTMLGFLFNETMLIEVCLALGCWTLEVMR